MEFDSLTERLTAEYSLLLMALNGRYQQIRAPGIDITPRVIAQLGSAASALAETFYNSASAEIERYTRALCADAPDELCEQLVGRKKDVLARIRAMIGQNAHQTKQAGRTGINGLAGLLRGETGAVGLIVQARAGAIDFRVTTPSGRKWPAATLMRFVVRDFAYQSWIDRQACDARLAGNDLMQTSGGVVFSLLDTANYPAFDEIRAAVFHPNSSAVMVPHVSS